MYTHCNQIAIDMCIILAGKLPVVTAFATELAGNSSYEINNKHSKIHICSWHGRAYNKSRSSRKLSINDT